MSLPIDPVPLIDELLPFLRSTRGNAELILPKLGRLGLRRDPGHTGRTPTRGQQVPMSERVIPWFHADASASLEGAEALKQWVESAAPQARLLERIQELSQAVSAELATAGRVHIPGLGKFRLTSNPGRESFTYEPSPRLQRAIQRPGQEQPMPDGIFSTVLMSLSGPMFSPEELRALLDLAPPLPMRAAGPTEWAPTPSPPLLQSVYLMARLGRDADRFCLIRTDMERERARKEFLAQGPGGLRDVIPFSQAPDIELPEHFAKGERPSWLLPIAEQGKADPLLAWGNSPAEAARQPRLPLSSWVRLFSAESVLLEAHLSGGYCLTPRQLNKLLTAARELARGWTVDPWPEPSDQALPSPLFRLIHPLLPDLLRG